MLTDLGARLALIIDARTEGAVSNIHRLSVEEKAAADRADVLKAKLADLETRAARQASRPSGVSASTAQQLSRTKSELAGLESSLATVPRGAGLAEKALAKVGLQGTVTGAALASGLAKAGAGLAVFGTFEFLKSGIENYTHLADEIRAVQQASSGSAEDSSKLVAITTALGVSSDVAALGVFRLGKNIEQSPDKLAAYGIAVAHTKNGNTDLIGTLYNVATAYQKTSDGAARAKLVYDTFGRAGTTMLPILNANREQLAGIAKLAGSQGLIFHQQDLDRARELQIAGRELKDSFEGLAISASKTLVPALTEAADKMTELLNSQPVKKSGHLLGFLANFPYNLDPSNQPKGPSGAEKARQENAAAQGLVAQQALASAAVATLGGASDLFATPGQGLADARQTLATARQTLADAVTTRNSAAQALAKMKAGAPGADATSIEAAVARVHAAEAKLRAAQYVGGDAKVSSAQATLLSAQDALNKLRSKGGTETNKLAAATERLHKANEAVANARQKEQAAQRAKNQASGLSVGDVESQLRAKIADQTKVTGAEQKLAGLGASTDTLAYLNTLNQQTPGTLVKVAKGINAGLVASLNDMESQLGFQTDLFGTIAGKPEDWRAAGYDRAKQFADGYTAGSNRFGPSSGIPAPAGARPATPIAPTFHDRPITVSGGLTINGVEDPKALARKLAAEARHRALA